MFICYRNINYAAYGNQAKPLDSCFDGEEILDETVAMQFYKLF